MGFEVFGIGIPLLLGAEELQLFGQLLAFVEGEVGVGAHEGGEEGDEDGVWVDVGWDGWVGGVGGVGDGGGGGGGGKKDGVGGEVKGDVFEGGSDAFAADGGGVRREGGEFAEGEEGVVGGWRCEVGLASWELGLSQ